MSMSPTITEELVWRAVNQLAAQGSSITNGSVRSLLAEWTSTKGGSFSTIAPVLRTWKAKQLVAHFDVRREMPPEHLVDRSRELLGDLWDAALVEAHASLESERRKLSDQAHVWLGQKEELEAKLASSNATLRALEDRAAESDRRVQALLITVETLKGILGASPNRDAEATTSSLEDQRLTSLSRSAERPHA